MIRDWMRFLQRLALAAFALALVAAGPAPAPAPGSAPARAAPLPYRAPGQTVGTVNCANSLCHGSVTEWKGSHVLQNEYVTWSRLDKHARAYTVLLNERSKSIGRKLGLGVPPNEAKVCLDCHADNVPMAQRGERFALSDGVTCEGCHGPAQNWIASHTQAGATHADNIAHGMYPTSDAGARAKLCLSCHWGNADKFVTHRMMGAGHPRMSFELETFSMIAPAHFRVDDDYRRRKPAPDGAEVWAVGQALAVSEMMDILVDPKRGRDGLFPELVLFDCHACHHPMSDQRWAPRTAFGASAGPGVARLNDSNMLMLRAIAREMDPALGARVTQQVGRLQRASAGQGNAVTEATALRQLSRDVGARLQAHAFTDEALRGIALALVDEGLAGNYRDYAGAEQAAMAIGSVVDFMNKRGQLQAPAKVNAGLDRLYTTLANDEKYQPAEFQRRLREFRGLIATK